MADPVVGQLLPLPFVPAYAQPGGAGTVVTPGQTPEQKTGWLFPGCGHSVKSWDIRSGSVGGVAKKLICCPMCGYLQRIATEAELQAELAVGGMIFG